MADIIIAGAGASGMLAAWAAAEAGARVTVLEQYDRPGRKLLMTGNGRCNLTHYDQKLAQRYHSEDMELMGAFAHSVFDEVSVAKTLASLRTAGIYTCERDGYVYPRSLKASSVLALLLRKLESLHVKMKYSSPVTGASYKDGKWHVSVPGWTYEADCFIMAGGSPAGLPDGSDSMGELCRANDIAFEPFKPALTALMCQMPKGYCAAGERTDAVLTLKIGKTFDPARLRQETGQIQWTENGISGIAVFNLSTYAGEALEREENVDIVIDFFPDMDERHLAGIIDELTKDVSAKAVPSVLSGLLPEKILESVIGKNAFRSGEDAAKKLKAFALPVKGLRKMNASQVCRGGIALSSVDPDTMRIKGFEGLYACGEVIDADGPCGGYNLQWAWSTGTIAGRCAAERK